MKTINVYLNESKGNHDPSKVYDDLYADVEKDLSKWGAGPVYGWKGDKGICFSVSKGNAKKDDWITIIYNPRWDDLSISLSKFGTDDPDEAEQWQDQVYAGQESIVINQMLGIK